LGIVATRLFDYRFVQHSYDKGSLIEKRSLYSFISGRRVKYLVSVEYYPNKLYAIKFHDKNHRNSVRRYNLLTGKNEARSVILTCMRILFNEFYLKDRFSSFTFLGSPTPSEESIHITKRFKVYSRIVATYFNDDTFVHRHIEEISLYALIPKCAIEINSAIEEELMQMLRDNFEVINH
jgi:hypothetical protein